MSTELAPNHGPVKLNLAIGPDCPIRCEGCYNVFAEFGDDQKLVTAAEVIGFAAAASELGLDQITLSGGDPLHHPEIVDIVQDLRPYAEFIQMDTVGTAFMGETAVLYQGRVPGAKVPKVSMEAVGASIDQLNLPIDDGGRKRLEFRKGRSKLAFETDDLIWQATYEQVLVGINTVVTAANIGHLLDIRDIVEEHRVHEWQLFQFDPFGPNPSRLKTALQVSDAAFNEATGQLESEIFVEDGVIVSPLLSVKGLRQRIGSYIMINAAGIAHREELVEDSGAYSKQIHVVGHIVRNEAAVLDAIFAQHR